MSGNTTCNLTPCLSMLLVVAEMSDKVNRFMGCLGPHLINECTTSSMNPNIDIGHIQAYAQSFEERKKQQ